MSNVGYTPGTGALVQADLLGGNLVQWTKMTVGPVDTATPLTFGRSAASLSLPFALSTEDKASLDAITTALNAALPTGTNVIGGVTVADGSDAALGAKADAAYVGSGSSSVIATLKGIYAALVAALPSGTNLIGKVGIDQTTPGTTNLVSIGTNGTVTANAGTGTFAVAGNTAAGAADSGNGVKISGVFNTTLPTLTSGWRGDAQLSTRGELIVQLSAGGTAVGTDTNPNDARTNTSVGLVAYTRGQIYNGSTWDRARGDVNGSYQIMSVSASALVSPTTTSTTAVASSVVGKASAGNLYAFQGTTGATAGYFMVFNATTAPADGAVTPLKVFACAANTTLDKVFNVPIQCSTGIVIVFSSTGPFTKTASATAFISVDVK